ncbi:MAG: hypothetical protein NTZ90_15320 [Proteobacteria bacterium]|nr:hypothetical protein [Pseudomonadota bacterium]
MKSFVIGLVAASSLIYGCGKKSSSDSASVEPAPTAETPTPTPTSTPTPTPTPAPVAAPVATFVPLHPAAPSATPAATPAVTPAATPAATFVATGITGGWSNGNVDGSFPDNRRNTACKAFAQINESVKKAAFGYYCWYNNVAVTYIHVQSIGDIVSEANGTLLVNQTGGCDKAHNNTQLSTAYTHDTSSGATLKLTIPNITNGLGTLGLWSPSSMGAISSQHVGCIDQKTSAFTEDTALRTVFAAMAK